MNTHKRYIYIFFLIGIYANLSFGNDFDKDGLNLDNFLKSSWDIFENKHNISENSEENNDFFLDSLIDYFNTPTPHHSDFKEIQKSDQNIFISDQLSNLHLTEKNLNILNSILESFLSEQTPENKKTFQEWEELARNIKEKSEHEGSFKSFQHILDDRIYKNLDREAPLSLYIHEISKAAGRMGRKQPKKARNYKHTTPLLLPKTNDAYLSVFKQRDQHVKKAPSKRKREEDFSEANKKKVL